MSNLMKCKSRELRAGILYTTCGCCRRNGLQYDCPRSECQGRKICITKPFPKCCPSHYGNRFANVTMGKSTNPIGARSIRVFNDGGESHEILSFDFDDSPEILHSIFFIFSACVIQYDPCVGPKAFKDLNMCGPRIIKCEL